MKGRTKQRKISARFGRIPTLSLQIRVDSSGFIESLTRASIALGRYAAAVKEPRCFASIEGDLT